MSTHNAQLPASQQLLRLPEVLRLIPVSRSTWWAGVKSGRFPGKIKLGDRVTVWRATDIQKFIDEAAIAK